MRHGYALGQIILAGPATRYELAHELVRLGSKDWTITDAIGAEGLEFEISYVVTIFAPTASEPKAEMLYNRGTGLTEPVIIPGNPDAFEQQLRFLAENLALTFGQQRVIYHLLPTSFDMTTSQASYRRDTPRAEQTAPIYKVPDMSPNHDLVRLEIAREALDWRDDRGEPAIHVASETNPDLPEPERGNFGPAVLGDPSAVRAFNRAVAHAEPDDDLGPF